MPKFISMLVMGFAIFVSSVIGAAMGTIVGAVLLPVKLFSIISDDSTGKSSDKI